MRLLWLAVTMLGCGTSPKNPSSPSGDEKELETLFPPPNGEAMSCKRDDECHAPPCGPCTAGTVITHGMLEQECVVNPCKNPAARCTSDHTCAVK